MRRLDIPVERRLERHKEALDRIRALPGVRSAAAVSVLPSRLIVGKQRVDRRDGHAGPTPNQPRRARLFPDDGDPVDRGTGFHRPRRAGPRQRRHRRRNVRRKLLGGANPIGRRVRIEATAAPPEISYEIAGVVKNSVYMMLARKPTRRCSLRSRRSRVLALGRASSCTPTRRCPECRRRSWRRCGRSIRRSRSPSACSSGRSRTA